MTEVRHTPSFPYRVKRLYLLVTQFIDEAVKPFGIGRTQWQVISRVHRAGLMTQRDLQSILQVEPATLSGVVDALVTKGWLERLENPEDKRGRVLKLTPLGEQRYATIPNPVAAVERTMLEGVSAEDRAVVEQALQRMIENLEQGRE